MQEKDHYEILQVSPNAEPGVIKAAYRRLARKFHPDVDNSPGAAERMKEINAAYDILSDPAKRVAYDRFRERISAPPRYRREAPPEPERPRVPTIRCQNCGRIDNTLRLSGFLYIYSILIMSFKRGAGGLLCSSCRRTEAIKYSLVTLLFGWWGIPWGIFWSLEALGINLFGGKKPPKENAQVLRLLALQFMAGNQILEAVQALRDSLSFERDPKTEELLQHLEASPEFKAAKQPSERRADVGARPPSFLRRNWRAIGGAFIGLLLCLCVAVFWPAVPPSPPPPRSPAAASLPPSPTPEPTAPPEVGPTQQPPPQTTLPYSDDFSDPSSGWEVTSDEDREMGYSDGEYYILVKQPNSSSWGRPGRTFTDFRLEVDARKVAGSGKQDFFGVVFRCRDFDNFYVFAITSKGRYTVQKQVNNEWEILVASTSPHINQGQGTNHLAVVAQGPNFSFYVNGEHLVDVAEVSFTEGEIGLLAGAWDEASVRIHFDNLEVLRPTSSPSTEPSPTPPPKPPPPACPDPGVNIAWPEVNAHLAGVVEIRGTANIENFQYYKIEFGAGANPAEGDWHWIGEGRNPVEQGVLLIWDTAGLSAGAYSMRLTAVDKTGNYPAPCQVQLYIDESVTATPTPVPPTPTPIPPSPTPTPTTPTFSGCPGGCTYHPPDCDIKGNISYETGEKIYHVPGGEYYDATVIRPEYGERWFCTEQEAIAYGWRRSKR